MFLNEDARLFIQGRVSAEDDKASKLILEKVRLFDDMPRELCSSLKAGKSTQKPKPVW